MRWRINKVLGRCTEGACFSTGQWDAYCFCAGKRKWWQRNRTSTINRRNA